MQRIVVTGANKGIGLAIVRAILKEHEGSFVYLGSRDLARGQEAAASLASEDPTFRERIEVVAIDVASDASVAAAAKQIAASAGGEKLYGIVNNAGVGHGKADVRAMLDTNALGIHRVCEALLPLLEPNGGRIVNVTSAAGPSYVGALSADQQRFFTDPAIAWPVLRGFIDEQMAKDAATAKAQGLEGSAAYGLSKACANAYTLILAREHGGSSGSGHLVVNACTPGFIATDMTLHYAQSEGKSPADLGMKTPDEGARAPMFLLYGDVGGSGRYYGSDAKRSPLDRYRAPGSPPYEGP